MTDDERLREWQNWPDRGLMKVPASILERRNDRIARMLRGA